MILGNLTTSPRKWLIRMAARAFWNPYGDKEASITLSID
jgi:hypothetical protein